MANTACFIIVSRNDIPIYEAEVGSAPKEKHIGKVKTGEGKSVIFLEEHHDKHEGRSSSPASVYLTCRFRYCSGPCMDNKCHVFKSSGQVQRSGGICLCHCRLMLLHDSRNEDGIKTFFQEVHELYVKILLNPLYLPGSRITSSHFDTKVRALARKYL